MKAGLVGPSSQQRSLPFDAQRSVNLFAISDQEGKEQASMYSRPGYNLMGTSGIGPGIGIFASANGRCFQVSGSGLYEIFVDGSSILRGTLNVSQSITTMAENGLQLAVCDGQYLYILTYGTNVFQNIAPASQFVTNGSFAAWTAGSGWTLGASTATASTSSAAITTTANSTLISGNTYVITYTVTRTAGTVTPSIGGTAGIIRSVPGTYTESIVSGGTQAIAFTGAAYTGIVSNVTVTNSAAGFVSASTVDFINGYFVISVNNTSGVFQISALYDGTSWAALDFATAESSPDPLEKVLNVSGNLWLFGSRTIEVWANTGALNFPFQKIAGGVIGSGIISNYAAISLDNSAFWVGNNIEGNGIVYRADGFSPQRISTETIERRIAQAPLLSSLRCTKYQEEGHTYLCITGGGMETTLVYDLATSLWHERSFLNDDGTYGLDLAAEYAFAFGKQIAVDRTNGNFYQQSLDFYSDNGREIARDRVFTHISNENQRTQFKNLTVCFESGVGNEVDPASNPHAILYLSKDGGRTWSNGIARAIGKVGKYLTRCTWQRLGQAREMTFRVRVTDPVKVTVTGAYFNT